MGHSDGARLNPFPGMGEAAYAVEAEAGCMPGAGALTIMKCAAALMGAEVAVGNLPPLR